MNDRDNPPTILVVDDAPENLFVLMEILKADGYAVKQVKNGRQALDSAKTVPPDLVLLDIMMPGMDGYEVCAELKKDDALKDIPVIFLTALRDSADKVLAFAVGGVDYIIKPFDADEVLARVRAHLSLARQRKDLEEKIQSVQAILGTDIAPKKTEAPPKIRLSEREKECLMWLARGLRNDRIAERLDIKPVTVQRHLDSARRKLDAATREQALSIAIQIGAVSL